MLRSNLIGLAIFGLIAGAVASAQAKMDCGALYKGFHSKYQAKVGDATPEKLAEVNRLALRAYDACQAGDEFNAQTFFQTLDAEHS